MRSRSTLPGYSRRKSSFSQVRPPAVIDIARIPYCIDTVDINFGIDLFHEDAISILLSDNLLCARAVSCVSCDLLTRTSRYYYKGIPCRGASLARCPLTLPWLHSCPYRCVIMVSMLHSSAERSFANLLTTFSLILFNCTARPPVMHRHLRRLSSIRSEFNSSA